MVIEEYFKYNENWKFRRITKSIDYNSFESFFDKVKTRGVILESAEVAPIYGRLSLILIDPPVQIIGKKDKFEIIALNKRGEKILELLNEELFRYATDLKINPGSIKGYVEKENENKLFDESKRFKQRNISYVIRTFLDFFSAKERFSGLYGVFSYDFVRLFEDIPDIHEDEGIPDFNLFLPDFIVYFDHLKEQADIYLYDFYDFDTNAEEYFNRRYAEVEHIATKRQRNKGEIRESIRRNRNRNLITKRDYEEMVIKAKEEMRKGEIFEIVLSHSRYFKCDRAPLEIYQKFRTINPSPYLFYVNFGEDCLVGASPEMFLRVEDGRVQTRPISGTIERGENAIDDYNKMMELLNSKKEKSELDMLIDLARNDIARVCKPGIEVKDYRFVEKYSGVMHTVAHVEGMLDTKNFELFDAFIVSLNAGTLTGAPKVAAMNLIENFEKSRRGYYGGNVGYITFSGNLDFGIIIRTAYIRNNIAEIRVGATLLYDSEPEKEYIETMNKGSVFFKIIEDIGIGA
ncbi:MAG: chorismate-binding protein [Halobacteriota archaeon]